MNRVRLWMPMAWLSLSLAAPCSGQVIRPWNVKPSFVGDVTVTRYDGREDDLLTAGLGWKGLQGELPKPKDIARPTAAEIRRLAIWNNYRAIVDVSWNGGFGRLYGPNVPAEGRLETPSPADAGKVPGVEYLAYCLDPSGRPAATFLVQIPDSFDKDHPCILAAASPGSRGVYGAIALAGEWGLKHGCAVVSTDKGTGNGVHDLVNNRVILIDGLTADATSAGNASLFTADLTEAERQAYVQDNPFSYAVKHAHSRRNPEKDWGQFTLQAIEFALYAINDRYVPPVPGASLKPRRFIPANTLVIACSVSNGGGAALAAAEKDVRGLIDAVVVGEPQVSLRPPPGLRVRRGAAEIKDPGQRALYDWISYANLLQPIAAFKEGLASAPSFPVLKAFEPSARKRAGELVDKHVLAGASFPAQAKDALEKLHEAGWEPGSDFLHAIHYISGATTGVTVTFASAYTRSSVKDNLLGFSFATTLLPSPRPREIRPAPMPLVFGVGNGIPPIAIPAIGQDKGGSIDIMFRGSNSRCQHLFADGDFAFAGAWELRRLSDGHGDLAPALRKGVDEVQLSGHLRGKPAIIVHGRDDALVLVNHTSRPYLGMNQLADGRDSRLSYIEVTNAQHFDGLLALPGFPERYLPLNYFEQQALDMIWKHLRTGAPLPPSQVVRTTPRGSADVPVSVEQHLGRIAAAPPRRDRIVYEPSTRIVMVPE
jgi:hydroxybutyrate-dimer hydrolase